MESPAKVYRAQRTVRVGKTAKGEEATIRFFKRDNRGRAEGSISYTYVGGKRTSQDTITDWDARYRNYIKGKRVARAKKDWLGEFGPDFDDVKDSAAVDPPKRKHEEEEDGEDANKKPKTAHIDHGFLAFMRGEVLGRAVAMRLAKQLTAKLNLKQPPSLELIDEMGRYCAVMGSTSSPFDFYKWDEHVEENKPDDDMMELLGMVATTGNTVANTSSVSLNDEGSGFIEMYMSEELANEFREVGGP